LLSIIIVLLPLTDGGVKKTSATSMLSSNLTSTIPSINTVLNPSSANHSLLVAQSPFYEADIGKTIGQVVSSSEPPQIEVSDRKWNSKGRWECHKSRNMVGYLQNANHNKRAWSWNTDY
jgi:hypothetical protein